MKRALVLLLLLIAASTQGFAQAPEAFPPAPAPVEQDPEIRVGDVPEDDAIRDRLSSVLLAIDGLEDVEVTVNSGVITLTGNVPSSRAARELISIAERVEGVVHVRNRLNEQVDISARVRPATQKFQEMGTAGLQMLPIALVALLVTVIFWFLGKWAGNRGAWLQRVGLSELASLLGLRVIRTVITGIGFLLALEILDITALFGAILGVAGVVGIAVGFAFRNIVENYLAGVLLSARNPFEIGDQIEVGTFQGKVMRLTSRDTVLMTGDGNHLRIPNNVIITSAMTNFTRNPLRRFEFRLGVSVNADLVATRKLGMQTLRGIPGILADPGPRVEVIELGDSSVQLLLFAWIDQRETDFLKARSEAIRLVKTAFDQADIEMPEPIYRVLIGSSEPHTATALDNLEGTTRSSPAERPRPPRNNTTESPEAPDVTADRTIDKQVEDELRTSGEENLLNRTDQKKSK